MLFVRHQLCQSCKECVEQHDLITYCIFTPTFLWLPICCEWAETIKPHSELTRELQQPVHHRDAAQNSTVFTQTYSLLRKRLWEYLFFPQLLNPFLLSLVLQIWSAASQAACLSLMRHSQGLLWCSFQTGWKEIDMLFCLYLPPDWSNKRCGCLFLCSSLEAVC